MKDKPRKSKFKRNEEIARISSASLNGFKDNGQSVADFPSIVPVIDKEFPPPDYLVQKARGESNRRLIEDYLETIHVLRDEKGFSFREIGDWLTENGIEADYNAVYRVYTKGMSEDEERHVAMTESEQERAEEKNL